MLTWVRHLPLLQRANWLWDLIRPIYEGAINHFGRDGLERIINGSDRILVCPKARSVSETYEPEVWRALMTEVRMGDTFVDVGAFIGLYTIAVAHRLGGSGRVIAFEPDGRNFSLLQEHVRLNRLERSIELRRAAVSDKDGRSCFLADGSSEARLVSLDRKDAALVDVVTLDRAFAGDRIDILKIDVEGYEEMVLRGAKSLLGSPTRPRAVFVEVHPYAWASLGTTGESLIGLLENAGYRVETPRGYPINSIDGYGEIIAKT